MLTSGLKQNTFSQFSLKDPVWRLLGDLGGSISKVWNITFVIMLSLVYNHIKLRIINYTLALERAFQAFHVYGGHCWRERYE